MNDTHAEWIAENADRCIQHLKENGWDESSQHLNNVAHQIAQSRPRELLEFVKNYPDEKAQKISSIMVLAWRIVGNEFKEEMAEQQKKSKNKFTPNPRGKNPKKPSNYYWIYAIVGVAIIGLQLFNFDGGSSNITEKEFEEMVVKNQVEYVVVVKNKNIARVTLTEEALELEEYKKKIKSPLLSTSNKRGPHFSFEFLSQDGFYEELKRFADSEHKLKYKVILLI